ADTTVAARPPLTSLSHEETSAATVAAHASLAAGPASRTGAAAAPAAAPASGTAGSDTRCSTTGSAEPSRTARGLSLGAVAAHPGDRSAATSDSISTVTTGASVTARAARATVTGDSETRQRVDTASLSSGAARGTGSAVTAGATRGAVGSAGDVVIEPGNTGAALSTDDGVDPLGAGQPRTTLPAGPAVAEQQGVAAVAALSWVAAVDAGDRRAALPAGAAVAEEPSATATVAADRPGAPLAPSPIKGRPRSAWAGAFTAPRTSWSMLAASAAEYALAPALRACTNSAWNAAACALSA
ncbi:hypothetical protein AO501_27125, partial [Mycobacterium gordonae]